MSTSLTAGGSSSPVDSETRARALDPTRSFCVTAPAGSGKTELLSQRVLRLLAQAQQPEDILAITFTRKAAAEMQERIIAALRIAAVEGEPAAAHKRLTWQLARAALQRDAELGWQLLQNPARLRVMTIDGLCASLTRQLPVLSTFGGSAGISDDAESLYREAVQALLAALESEGPIADALADLLLHLDNDSERLQRLLIGLLANRDQWLRHIGTGALPEASIRSVLESTLQTIVADALTDATQRLHRYQGDLLPALDFAATQLRESDPDHALAAFAGCIELPESDAGSMAVWRALVGALLTQAGGWRKKLDKRDGFPVGDNPTDKKAFKARKENLLALIEAMSVDDGLLDTLVQLRHLPTPTYPDAQWRMLWHLMLLLPVAAAQLKVVFQQHGEVDYTEVAQAALNALGDADAPGELMLRLDARIRHILVDEFQDTSSSQFQLLKLLLEGWAEHNASDANRDAQQTLFIVGDGMQSIYGFRAANVGLFLGARRRGVNAVALDDSALTVNFRSTPTIVNWVNQTFARAFPQVEKISRGAVPYENSQAFNADRAGSEVGVFGVQGDDERVREAALCVQLAQQSLQASASGDVAILVRNRSHLRAIVPALGTAGIAWRAADIDPLAARTAVMDLLTLFKALSNLADRIAWLALLRSPLIGLDNRDLHAIAGGSVRSVWSSMTDAALMSRLSSAGAAALQRAVEVIDAAFAQRSRQSPRSWLEGVWFALGGACCLAGDDDWRNLYTLFDLIEQLPAGADITQLETRVATLYAQPRVVEGVRLSLMTIHKSKGLEFDTVIIPGLDKMPRSDDKPLLQWGEYLDRDGREGLVLAAAPAFGGDADAIYDWLDFERKQKQQLEDTRLFYVAATRAISRLYLLFCDNRTNTEKPFAPPSRSLLARIWDGVSESVQWQVSTPTQISLLDVDAEPATLVRVPPQWRMPLAPSSATLASGANLPDLSWREETAEIHAGILIHALLEQCAIAGVTHWLQRTPEQRRKLVEHLARQRAVAADLRDTVIDKVIAALDTALADERGRWLFDAAHTEGFAEWDLSLDDGRQIVDRSFVDADGARWIVDYKTSMPHPNEPLVDFYARESDAYRQQLFGYRDAVAAFDVRPIRLAIYFPCVPGWCEL